MTWETPNAFFIFIPLLLSLVFLISFGFKRKLSLQWSSLKDWQDLSHSLRAFLSWTPMALQYIAISLVIFALARPQTLNTAQVRSLDGIDIMVVLDISFSMMVEDMNPGNRLSAAKQVIGAFIEGLHSDRVGLILFSGESYTKIPLTLDYALVQEELQKIETSADIQQGTAIGVALANAVSRLRHSPSRVIILLTDGENNAGNISPATAISLAQKYDIKVYSIGIGTGKTGRIPIKERDILGRERTVYATIHSRINKKLLSEISEKTNGKFYLAKSLKNLEEVFEEIGKIEKSPIQIQEHRTKQEHFQEYLTPALFLYLLSLALSLTVFGKII